MVCWSLGPDAAACNLLTDSLLSVKPDLPRNVPMRNGKLAQQHKALAGISLGLILADC